MLDYEEIDEAILNDEFWSCFVVLLTEYNIDFEQEIDAFKSFAIKSGTRFSIEVITPLDIKTTDSLTKGKTAQSTPSTSDISSNKKLALNIKNHLLNVRTSREIKYIEEDDDDGHAAELLAKSKVEKKKETKEKTADSKRNAADKKLHDEPKCGPNKYFILIGFYDVPLIEELIKTNVPIIAAICYGKEERFQKIDPFTNDDQNINRSFDIDISSIHSSSKSKITGRAAKVEQFWFDLIKLVENPLTNGLITDLAIIPCNQPKLIKYPQSDIPINPKDKGKFLYDHISLFIYDIANDYRKYIHFINTANTVYIPLNEPLTVFQHYEKKVNEVPNEYITVEYIVYCLVEHVHKELNVNIENCKHTKKHSSESEPHIINANDKIKRATFNIKSPDISKLSHNIYKQMPYIKLLKKYFNTDLFKKIKLKSQLKLLYECLDNFISDEHFEIILNQILFTQMYDIIVLTGQLYGEETVEERLEEVVKCEEQNVLEEEKLSEEEQTDLKNITERKFNENLFKKKRKIQLEKLKQFFHCEQFENLKKIKFEKNEILDYSIVNDLNEYEMLQSLQRAFLKYTSMNFQPFSGTDSVLIFFHNDYNKYGVYRTAISGLLMTPVGFRDFHAYIKDNIQFWLNNQKHLIEFYNRKWRKEYIRMKNERGELVDDKDVYPEPRKVCGSTPVQVGFTLYDIADYAVKANESLTIFYSIDGVQLKIKTMDTLYSYKLITMVLKSFGSKIVHHRAFADKENSIQNLNYFNVFMKNGTIINCVQELINEPIESSAGKLAQAGSKKSTNYRRTEKSKKDSQKKKVEFTDPNALIDKYNFNIVQPNGLKIEIRHYRDYIKQYYIEGSDVADNIKNENYRIFLKNGTVLIFNKDGTIMVLYNNGTRVKLRKVVKREVIVKDDEQMVKEDKKKVTDKDKDDAKGKGGKSKGKDDAKGKSKGKDDAKGKGKSKGKDDAKGKSKGKDDAKGKSKGKDDAKGKKKGNKSTDESVSSKKRKGKSAKKSAVETKKNEEEGAIVKTRIEYAATDLEVFSWNGEYYMYCNNTLYDVSYPYKLRVGNNGYQFICNKTDGSTSLFTDTLLKMLHPDGTLIVTKIVDDPPYKNYYNPDTFKEGIQLNTDKLFRLKFQTFFRPYFIRNYPDISAKLLEEIESTYARCYPKLEFKQDIHINNSEIEIIDRINEEVYDMFVTCSTSQEDLNINAASDQHETEQLLKFQLKVDEIYEDEAYDILSVEHNVQHDNYAHVTYNGKLLNWIITLAGHIKIFSSEIGHYILNSHTQILIKEKCFKVLSKSDKDGITTTKFYVPRKSEGNHNLVCKSTDSIGRMCLINTNGIITNDFKSKLFKPEQRKLYNKFIVLKENMSGYEFIHKDDNNIKIKRYIDMAPENQIIDINLNVYAHTITIDKTLSEKYRLPIDNPFKTINISRKHMSNYYSKPQNWLFNLQPPQMLNFREIRKEHRAPLAAVYRKIRNGYREYDQLNVQLKEAFRKVDMIKSYVRKLYENKAIYFENPVQLADLDKIYAHIYKYIGSANTSKTS